MGKKRKAASGPDPEDLSQLPQVADEVWQADIRRSPAWVRVAGVLQRPWMVLVTNRTEDLVLAHEIPAGEPDVETLWQNLAAAMCSPGAGQPHRPAEVQLRTSSYKETLASSLAEIGIACVVRGELDHLEYVLDDLGRHLRGGRSIPTLIDVPGMTLPQVARYFEAAASFYRRRPWELVRSDRPIRVECDKYQSGPWQAVVMGQSGLVRGLALHEGEDSLREILAADRGGMGPEGMGPEGMGPDEAAAVRHASAISIMYGEKFEISVRDLDCAEKHGWTVADSRAYPFALRVNPGRAIRAPLSWELELLEACLWSIPDFLKLPGAGAARLKVPVIAEDMQLRLSWTDGR